MRIKSLLLASVLAAATTSFAAAQDAAVETTPEIITNYAFTEAPDDHATGSESAAQTLIIYASVTCPHCGNWFSKEWPEVKTSLVDTDTLRVVFREFPTQPAELAMTGFLMAECAPSTDYFDLIEHQMEEQEAIFDAVRAGKGKDTYDAIAKKAGMSDDAAITECFRNPDMANHIYVSQQRADAAKVKSVPSFFINGELYKGKQDAESLVALIKDMDAKGLTALPDDIAPLQTDHSGHDHD